MSRKIPENCIDEVRMDVVEWIRGYMLENANEDTPIIIGISGGKDSTVTAALCVEAVGKEKVIGVLMPDGKQKDIDISRKVVEHLGIKSYEVNIKSITDAMFDAVHQDCGLEVNDIYQFNTPARIRMSVLYGIAGILGGRVANTCNFTESYLGYDTKWGDQCGDFAPLANILCTDVSRLGEACGIPPDLCWKAPDDGMCGKIDEERFGFAYEDADNFLDGKATLMRYRYRIRQMHDRAKHKECTNIPTYQLRIVERTSPY